VIFEIACVIFACQRCCPTAKFSCRHCCAGELKEYVVEEVNVRSLKTCADPLQYCTLRAEPDYPSLGKRLGKGMAKVGKAVKSMSIEQILDFESRGSIELEGESLGSGEIRVSHAD